ncbi:beta-glucosidase [Nitriliruptoraceae bacterium ZYF776]|nr:beta-glucosidase [Profundirhabdus halotolerans]
MTRSDAPAERRALPSGPELPEGFTFGVATSSYQIEGAVDVDGRGPSIWDTFSHTPGAVVGGDTGDVACDHYHRLEEDLDLLAWLGVDAYRFSIAWPRVLPDGDRIEPRGLAFYDRLVDGLLARGITPFATLYHWDLPQALEDRGGWADRAVVDAFVRYAEVVGAHLGDRVRDWTTLNEPWCAGFLGYDAGVHAPGRRDPAAAIAANHHLLLAHGHAIPALRRVVDDARLGIVLNLAPISPLSDDPADRAAATLADGLRNRVWSQPLTGAGYPDDVLERWAPLTDLDALHRDGDLRAIAAPLDLLGLNYYNRVHVGDRANGHDGSTPAGPGQDHVAEVPGPPPSSAMGWSIDPTGLDDQLRRLADEFPGLPLYVTENGGAFPDVVGEDGTVDDRDRLDYLDGHLRACARAIADGVPLAGYFAWSLMDNFEWAEGYACRFGLVHVDFDTQVRTPKTSAYWYRQLLAQHG